MRELKKIRISRISIVASPASTRSPWIMTKSMDNLDDDPYGYLAGLFPLVVPSHLIEKAEREKALEDMRKADDAEKDTAEDDPYPSLPIIIPEHLLNQDDEDDDDDDED